MPPAPHPVLLCHGLWMPSVAMGLLAHRLRRRGWRPVLFDYSATRESLSTTAERLHRTIQSLGAQGQPVHVIGHSLGGVLAVHLLQRHGPCCQGGRVVCLGSPLMGSDAAHWLGQHPLGQRALGVAKEALWTATGSCPTHTPVGMVAGTYALGAGLLLQRLTQHPRAQPRPTHPTGGHPSKKENGTPNDGTVWVHETHCPGLADHVLVNRNHTGLTLDSQVADLCHRFLTQGRFSSSSP